MTKMAWDLDENLNPIQVQLNDKEDNKQMKFNTTDKESTDFERPHVEEGLHIAEFIESKEISEGTYGARCIMLFNLVEQNVELGHIVYTTNDASPANKLGQALIALGVELGKPVDTETLKGTKCRVLVEDYDIKDDTGKVTGKASSISKVKPLAEKPTA